MPSLRRAIMPLCPFLPRAECRFPYLVWPVCCWGQERTWPIRDLLWDRVSQSRMAEGGIAVYSDANEQGFSMRLFGMPHREAVDMEGIQLIRISDTQSEYKKTAEGTWGKWLPAKAVPLQPKVYFVNKRNCIWKENRKKCTSSLSQRVGLLVQNSVWNIPNINKKSEPVPHREEVRISYVWWRLRDSNPSKCKKPVASCGHQFKNWWQPYALPGAKRPSSPVVLPVHEKSGLFHIVGVCFLGFGIFK